MTIGGGNSCGGQAQADIMEFKYMNILQKLLILMTGFSSHQLEGSGINIKTFNTLFSHFKASSLHLSFLFIYFFPPKVHLFVGNGHQFFLRPQKSYEYFSSFLCNSLLVSSFTLEKKEVKNPIYPITYLIYKKMASFSDLVGIDPKLVF